MGLFSTTHIHRSETKYVPYCEKVTVTENKAPTDESVRLLNEMQAKAQANIIKSIEIKENELSAIVIYYAEDHPMDRIRVDAKFTLNGKEHRFEMYVDRVDLSQIPESYLGLQSLAVLRWLTSKYSELIAEKLIKTLTERI